MSYCWLSCVSLYRIYIYVQRSLYIESLSQVKSVLSRICFLFTIELSEYWISYWWIQETIGYWIKASIYRTIRYRTIDCPPLSVWKPTDMNIISLFSKYPFLWCQSQSAEEKLMYETYLAIFDNLTVIFIKIFKFGHFQGRKYFVFLQGYLWVMRHRNKQFTAFTQSPAAFLDQYQCCQPAYCSAA